MTAPLVRDVMTPRGEAVLRFIAQKTRELGFPPSIREIAEALGIHSTNGVADHLSRLERYGFIIRSGSKSRGTVITRKGHQYLSRSGDPKSRVHDLVDELKLINREIARLRARATEIARELGIDSDSMQETAQ